ncbi:MAG: hypothetical protein HRT47_11160 [Candidatus Caenarcaniphilales bacterium]|nr:hypothetical protein [Candidatus Caenarcaniphilales bacterium]
MELGIDLNTNTYEPSINTQETLSTEIEPVSLDTKTENKIDIPNKPVDPFVQNLNGSVAKLGLERGGPGDIDPSEIWTDTQGAYRPEETLVDNAKGNQNKQESIILMMPEARKLREEASEILNEDTPTANNTDTGNSEVTSGEIAPNYEEHYDRVLQIPGMRGAINAIRNIYGGPPLSTEPYSSPRLANGKPVEDN